jgi:transcriptional regulator with XRE-family HTH domain
MPPRVGSPHRKRLHFIREWRRFRKLTLEQLGERMGTTKANLSRVENGKQGATRELLAACAAALDTDVWSLEHRPPHEPETIWPIWEQATEAQRRKLVEIAKTLVEPED